MARNGRLLRHMLATLAYRTQKALRGAADDFGDFSPGNRVRTPSELVHHMTSVLGYARAQFRGGRFEAEPVATLAEEVARFHDMLDDLSDHLTDQEWIADELASRLLQGPLSDAMTHAGQLAMLRRLHGAPVEPENFFRADVDPANVTAAQPAPRAPGRRDGSGADPIH